MATLPDRLGLQSMLSNNLFKAYTTSLQLCLGRPCRDYSAVDLFLMHWVDDSMQRAWASLENAGVGITEDLVARLFQNLISPLGDQVPFSCIPIQLTDLSGGPPPREWAQVRAVTQQVLAAWRNEESRAAKKRKQRRPLEEGMTDYVVHSCQSKNEDSENNVSESNGMTFPIEYSPTSQMTSCLTGTNPVTIGVDEEWEEDSDDTSYQVIRSVGSEPTNHTSDSNELGDHNLWDPMLELFCHSDIGLLMETLVDDMVLAMVALSCHFALESKDEEEMEAEGPVVDGTELAPIPTANSDDPGFSERNLSTPSKSKSVGARGLGFPPLVSSAISDN